MILADYHIHTCFSGDSDAKPEEIVEKAVSQGLQEICITDHQDFGFYAEGVLFELDEKKYYQKLCEIQERYASRIRIKKGVETGLEPDKAEKLKEFVGAADYDFVIGSSHLINGKDPYYKEFFEGKTEEEAITEYFCSILKNLEKCHNFDVYGHLDYIVRYCPHKTRYFSYEKYRDMIDTILKKLIDMGKGIELNTGGYRSGLNAPNPCRDILIRYRELGGEIITIGSDAHRPEYIGDHFKDAGELLGVCGYRYYCTFRRRQPEFLKLS